MINLIDGDGLVYRCGFAVEKTKYAVEAAPGIIQFDTHKEAKAWLESNQVSRPLWSRKEVEPVENALALVKGSLEAMPDGEKEIWLTPSVGNFRERFATIAKYKGNRDYVARPTYYREITDYLVQRGAKFTVGQEADDELGIRATEIGDSAVIVSFDKDLDQIPGHHYNWVTKEAYSVTPRVAAMNFYSQILSGDAVDNVPGIPGIGPKTAQKLLGSPRSPKEAWDKVLGVYNEKFGSEGFQRALETARLVYVRRKRDEIWQPPEG